MTLGKNDLQLFYWIPAGCGSPIEGEIILPAEEIPLRCHWIQPSRQVEMCSGLALDIVFLNFAPLLRQSFGGIECAF